MARPGPASVAEYLDALEPDRRAWVDDLRSTIREVLPDAREEISYQIVAFKRDGRAVVWYAVFQSHYSLYPVTDAVAAQLGDEIKPYRSGKGTLRFPAGQPVPKELVRRVVQSRAGEPR